MTTIAVDVKRMVIASDSCINDGNTAFSSDKIFVADDGTLIAISGNYTDCLLFVDWYKAGADRTKRPEYSASDVGAITLNDKGCWVWGNEGVRMPMRDQFYATGMGGKVAMAVLMCGKSIEEAIEISCKLHPEDCRLPVNCIAYVKPKKTARAAPKTKTRR